MVLDELLEKYGNTVLKETGVHSPLNEMLSAIAGNTDLSVGNKPSVADIMSGIMGDNVPNEQAELLKALIGGVSEAVSQQNFKLKRHRKFNDDTQK